MPFYRLLLHLYPASFRHEYGAEMQAIFAERQAAARGLTVVSLTLGAIGEIVINATLVHLEILRQDLHYTARMLRRSPGFTITAIVVVALGIGATTAAFSVTDFVLIRPLPFPQADRLVRLWERTPGYGEMQLSPPNYRDWAAAATSFESIANYTSDEVSLTNRGEPRRLTGASVSASLFTTLRVAPAIGRAFTGADDAAGAGRTMILACGFWQSEFGGDPGVLGRTLTLDGEPYVVIGVMPREFHFPSSDVLFWTPNQFGPDMYQDTERTNNFLEAVGRLRQGVSLAQARVELEGIAARLEIQHPKENKDTGATLLPLGDDVSESSRLLLWALSGAAACVLLIACANLANLLLTRALGRRRELAVRAAMGADRERLVRQLMTESLLLAAAGGTVGIGIAVLAVPLLTQLIPATLPIAASPAVDLRVLAFAVALSVLTGLVFGLAPVLRVGRRQDSDGLREGPRSGGGRKERGRSALVVAEIAATVALLVSAGLLIRALMTVRGIDPGFKPEGVITMRTDLPMPDYRTVAARQQFYSRVLDAVRTMPGVTAAGFVSYLPMSSFRGGIWPVAVKGDAAGDTRTAATVASLRYATPGYFTAMGIPVVRGRDLSDADTHDRAFVAVVSASFVKRYWPNDDPIGRHFIFAFADREVVGVVGDVRFRGLERASEPQVYLSPQQVDDGSIVFYAPKALAVRTSASPEALVPLVRGAIRQAGPALPIFEVQTLTDLVDLETASRAAQARILAAFAIIAFGLGAIGLHGVLSFAVSQRTNEIGVRVALGARSSDILWMVLSRGAALAVAGVIPGVALAYAAGRSMQALLAGVPPADPATLAGAIALSILMTGLGTIVPTVRALRVDPIRALRSE